MESLNRLDPGQPQGSHQYHHVQLSGDVRAQLGNTYNISGEDPLSLLPFATNAPFNSFSNQHEPTCLHNTRVDLLHEIYDWADGKDKRCVFWLNGAAGTGKSTIARTIARKYYNEERLGASFFFSRGGGDVSHAGKFFTSIASQLASQSNALKGYIREAIIKDCNIAGKGLHDQWTRLILQPLSKLEAKSLQSPLLIIVDALDECNEDNDIRAILQCLVDLNSLETARLYICITSRPETPIRLGFRAMPGVIYHDLVLHNVPRIIVDQDISVFFKEKFKELRDVFEDLTAEWPGDESINLLVQKAEGLFIYAATVYRFIKGDEEWPPQNLLSMCLSSASSNPQYKWEHSTLFKPPTWELDQMYTRLLQYSFKKVQQQEDKVIELFKQVVGSLAIVSEPLSAIALAKLLDIPIELINLRLRPLHSVLNIPEDKGGLIRMHHPSFRDFLLDKDRCSNSQFWVDERQTHRMLADNCIRLMSNSLTQDICKQEAPGTLVTSVKSSQIDQYIPSEVRYACLYWIQHLQKSNPQLHDNGQVHQFLQVHLLHWLEALGWISKALEGIFAILSLEALILANESPNLHIFIHDAKRFAFYNRSVIERAPLQLYHSALIFAPEESTILTQFEECIPPWVQMKSRRRAYGSAAWLTVEGHFDGVTSVAFSPDSKLVVSGSYDNTMRLWDAATGAPQQTLKSHFDGVRSVAYSPDGGLVASGSDDNAGRLWDAVTRGPQQTLKSHFDGVRSVAFSPDGRLVVSGSDDNAVRLWDAATGALQQTLRGHSRSVMSVAFSPDGGLVVSGSGDMTVRLWDAATGALRQTLRGHPRSVMSVAFSPDGGLVVSGSYDNTVRLWDAATGALQQTLEGHSDSVMSVAFSPDGGLVASGSDDNTVRLWDAATGALQQTLRGHSHSVRSVAFSPDGGLVVSGSGDMTVRLWDAATGALQQTLKDHLGWVMSVAFSPDGGLVVSGSGDGTVRLWDVTTGTAQHTLAGHSDISKLVAFSFSSNVHCLCVSGDWIAEGGTNILWLPPDYRANSIAFWNGNVVIGHSSSHISLLQFKQALKLM